MPLTVVCLGARDSGKTTLLRKIQNSDPTDEPPLLQPTIGVNHFAIRLDLDLWSRNQGSGCWTRKRTKDLVVKEFGGTLAPVWTNYLQNSLSIKDSPVRALLFTIDLSNAGRLAESGVHLVEILQVDPGVKVLVVFTKADLVDDVAFEKVLREFKALLRIDFLAKSYDLETLTVSSQTDFGIFELVQFLAALQ